MKIEKKPKLKIIVSSLIAVLVIGLVSVGLVTYYLNSDNEVLLWDEEVASNFYLVVGEAEIDEEYEVGTVIYDTKNTAVYAVVNYSLIEYGLREREDISSIYPAGWSKNEIVDVTFYDGTTYHGYFLNRSQFLADALGGEDSIENLITGTRAQNAGKNDSNDYGGMQYCEMKAIEYLEANQDSYIYYYVTCIYKNRKDVIPYIVEVNMLSEDGSINEKVYVYNVMPGYEIDYQTGTFELVED